MRLLAVILIALVGLIQYPLWLGKGGWFRVWSLQGQVAEQREINEGLRARNAALAAEVQDLQSGTGALEERARGDLGMIREGEVFVQILPPDTKPPAGEHGTGATPRPGAKPAPAATSRPATSANTRPAASSTPGARPATSSSAPGTRATTPSSASSARPTTAPNARPATAPSNARGAPASGAGAAPSTGR